MSARPQAKKYLGSRKNPLDPVKLLPSNSAAMLEKAKEATGQVGACSPATRQDARLELICPPTANPGFTLLLGKLPLKVP